MERQDCRDLQCMPIPPFEMWGVPTTILMWDLLRNIDVGWHL